MMTEYTRSAEETEIVGKKLAERLENAGIKRAFIAMRGEMGVGKTAFTRGFASHFGIAGVKSPTYTIVNEHRGRVNIYHFDMYRLSSADDLYACGFFDYVDGDGVLIVEWSENIPEALPEDAITVKIAHGETDDERLIEISGAGF